MKDRCELPPEIKYLNGISKLQLTNATPCIYIEKKEKSISFLSDQAFWEPGPSGQRIERTKHICGTVTIRAMCFSCISNHMKGDSDAEIIKCHSR